MLTVFIDTLGCAKNQVDSEELATKFSKHGYTVVFDPAQATIIIVNTCGFIESAKAEAIETLLYYRNTYPNKKIIAAGCLVQRYCNELSQEMPELDGFAGNGKLDDVLSVVESAVHGQKSSKCSIPGPYIPETRDYFFGFKGQAYVKISEGCSNHCSYCAIPLIRGELSSRPLTDIVNECKKLIELGTYELTLIGQDVGSYGKDSGTSLYELLTKLIELKGNFIIRLLYIHPDHFPLDILSCMKRDSRIVPYFDIPFQHASEKILRAMNRKGTSNQYLSLLETIRSQLPDAVIRSTFLVGFPGETEEDFQELLNFQKQAQFDWLGAFEYSREENTPAYDMKPRVAKKVAQHRRQQIEAVQQPISEQRLRRYMGTEQTILIEETITDNDLCIGRAFMQAPEVDGAVVLTGCTAKPGSVVTARIVAIRCIDLEGTVVS